MSEKKLTNRSIARREPFNFRIKRVELDHAGLLMSV